jgi:hypothetical protein
VRAQPRTFDKRQSRSSREDQQADGDLNENGHNKATKMVHEARHYPANFSSFLKAETSRLRSSSLG